MRIALARVRMHSAEQRSMAMKTTASLRRSAWRSGRVAYMVSTVSGDDGAVMGARSGRRARASRRKLAIPHQPEDAPQRSPGSGITQSRSEVAVAFAMNGTGRQHAGDRRCQYIVGYRSCWSAASDRAQGLMALDPGSGKPPNATDRRRAMRFARTDKAHGLSLRGLKATGLCRSALLRPHETKPGEVDKS
jgi:hypothetical protein